MSAQTETLKHFLRLAKRGKHPGASGGEKRAYQLAVAVLHNVSGMDGQATIGLIEFIEAVQEAPMSMQDEFED